MKTESIIVLLLFIALIAGNVWQWNNPKIVEVPDGQTQIDSTAWVQRSAYVDRGILFDSLQNENEALAERIRDSRDQIANYTSIIGRLKLDIDSLEANRQKIDLASFLSPENETSKPDTVLLFSEEYGDGLFRVDSRLQFTPSWVQNDLQLTQQRDIKLSVVNTMNDDRSRLLTYVTSPDFENLEYQTFTNLEQKRRLPWFWFGFAIGIAGTGVILQL